MLELNLDPHFCVGFSMSKVIHHKLFTFPGGEPHIQIKDPHTLRHQTIMITHRLDSFNKVGELLVAIEAVKACNPDKIRLFIPYFPGARQDRRANSGEALTAKVYADLINSYNVDGVAVLDPHSDVVPALLNNCNVVNNHDFLAKAMISVKERESVKPVIIAPDAGAIKKAIKLTSSLAEDGQHYELYNGHKHRDTKTGQLTGFEVHADNLHEQPCVIVDDICDGGGTFVGLAEELKKKNAGNIHLIVTHGIFSKGWEPFTKLFKSITCSDSFSTIDFKDPDNRWPGFSVNQLKIKDI